MNILKLEPNGFSNEAQKILEKMGRVFDYNGDSLYLDKILPDIDVIISRLGYNIDESFIKKSKNLKIIVSPTTGLDHIDTSFAKSKKIKVISLKNKKKFLNNIYATPEHSWALLLSLIRNIHPAATSVAKNLWNRESFKGRELKDNNIGILGYGRVGKNVARYARAFKMKIYVYDPYKDYVPSYIKRMSSLEEFLSKINILMVHMPLNDSTYNFLNSKNLSHLPKGSIIVNSSRGEIINETDLLDLLTTKHLSGCALDVIQNERDLVSRKESRLIRYFKNNNNLLITPHIAGATYESMEKTEIFVIKELKKTLLEK